MGLAAAGYPGNSTTDSVVEYLLQVHAESRRWKCSSNRPPTEASDITTFVARSAWTQQLCTQYVQSQSKAKFEAKPEDKPQAKSDSPPDAKSQSNEAGEKRSVAERWTARKNDCQKWFTTKSPADTEDRVFRLLQLKS